MEITRWEWDCLTAAQKRIASKQVPGNHRYLGVVTSFLIAQIGLGLVYLLSLRSDEIVLLFWAVGVASLLSHLGTESAIIRAQRYSQWLSQFEQDMHRAKADSV